MPTNTMLPRDTSRDREASGEIVTLSTCEVNADHFTLPTARVLVAHDDAVRCGPYDLGLDQPSVILISRRIEEEDAPRQARR